MGAFESNATRVSRLAIDLMIRELEGADGFRAWWYALTHEQRRNVERAMLFQLVPLLEGHDFT